MPPEPAISYDPDRATLATVGARATQPVAAGSRSWDLGGGALMTVSMPTKLSKVNIEKLKKYVTALELEASISWDDE